MAKPRSIDQWDRLSPAYRGRLQRSGIDRAAYLRGDSLSSARGHVKGKTPEHPQDFIRNPERYKDSGYKPKTKKWKSGPTPTERKSLETQAVRETDRKLGDRIKYNPLTVRQNVSKKTIAELIETITLDADDLAEMGSDTAYPARKGSNPFYYH